MNIAVTGLNATDNPGPGVPVIRSLKEGNGTYGRMIGLLYSTLDPGAFMEDVADRSYLIPYPSSGLEPVFERIRYIHDREKLDVLMPTLDTELYMFHKLADRLRELGIQTFLPDTEQLNIRSKDRIAAFCRANEIQAPETIVITSVNDLQRAVSQLSYPVVVKGIFYGAYIARNFDEAVADFARIRTEWGLPIIVQEYIEGDEFNIAALGDGQGGTVGAVAMRKTFITDKGKGWAGVTIYDADLLDMSRAIIEKLKWTAGLELEFVKSRRSGEYYLLEINPRFPAWIYLATAAGQNLPAACVELALGKKVTPFTSYQIGKMFIRCSWDLIADMQRFEDLTTSGEA
jgi:carbamoyl-phosphate synthase large subunit